MKASEKIFDLATGALQLWYTTICEESRRELVNAEIEAVLDAAKKAAQKNSDVEKLNEVVFSRFATRDWQPETTKICQKLGFDIIYVEGKLLDDLDKRIEPAYYALKKAD